MEKIDRKNYREIEGADFSAEVVGQLPYFIRNMKKLGVGPCSFPEWYELFGAWLEVGTGFEGSTYGPV